MKPPFIVDDAGDVQAFISLEKVEAYLEPPDVNCRKTRVFDSEGRLLIPRVNEWKGTRKLFGFISLPVSGSRVTLEQGQDDSLHEGVLRELLIGFLSQPSVQKRLTETGKPLDRCNLSELIHLLIQGQQGSR